MTQDELLQAARGQGHADLDSVRAVVLETDGTLSFLTAPIGALQHPVDERGDG